MFIFFKSEPKFVGIDSMQFGFRPGRDTKDAIFILRQLNEKYMAKGYLLYFAFVDLEKAFDRIPRKVISGGPSEKQVWMNGSSKWSNACTMTVQAVYV